MDSNPKIDQEDLVTIRDQLITYFNQSELASLCFDLGIGYESLEGTTLQDKSRALVQYCIRHNKLKSLSDRCNILRPHGFWPNFGNVIKPQQRNSIVVDTRILLGEEKGEIWEVSIEKVPKILDLLNHVYAKISYDVPVFSFGKSWMFRNASTGEIIMEQFLKEHLDDEKAHSTLLNFASNSTLETIGIKSGLHIEVIPPQN